MPGQVKIGLAILAVLVAVIVVGELRDRRQPEQAAPPAKPTTTERTHAAPSASDTSAKKSEADSERRTIFFELVSCEDRVTADAAAKIPDDYSSAKAGAAAMERRRAYEKPRMGACRTEIMKEYSIDQATLKQISEEGITNRWPPL
jgi:hypothetical protein